MYLTSASASLVASLFGYYKQWQVFHPNSLGAFYSGMCNLLHTSISLLIRPSVLRILVSQHNAKDDYDMDIGYLESLQRARRLSTPAGSSILGSPDGPLTSPEAANIQNKLLDIVSSCLSMLTFLTPDLTALLSNNLIDYDAYEILLGIGFSTPTFERDEQTGLTYGTVISIGSLCIRNLTKCSDRSPSPSKSPQSSSSRELVTMDKRKMVVVLEQTMYVLLSQALLILLSEKVSSRERQLLRRELGAELGSVTESVRRYMQRANRTPTSGSTPHRRPSASVLTKSDEDFMKLISGTVQKTFK